MVEHAGDHGLPVAGHVPGALSPARGVAGRAAPERADAAVETLEDDRLGFAPYVRGVVEFLKAKETQPPLALAVHGQWGSGKTSFMNMIESELKARSADEDVRFATATFNPWKYNRPREVWGAYVSTVTQCIYDTLGFWRRRVFKFRRFVDNLRRRFTPGLFLRFVVILALVAGVFLVAVHQATEDVALSAVGHVLGSEVRSELAGADLPPWAPPAVAFAVLVYLVHTRVVRESNLGLLEHLKSTRFEDKIGTLTEFEEEMRDLNRATPDDLKVVVFVDDLDRCSDAILEEVVENFQLLELSQRCFLVLGMDMRIVAGAVERRSKLIEGIASDDEALQHGRGYRFLEKIVQSRLNVPAYGDRALERMLTEAIYPTEEGDEGEGPRPGPARRRPGEAARGPGLRAKESDGERGSEEVRDSREVREAVKRYAPEHFAKPRRMKRHVNDFRLHAYLASRVEKPWSADQLARFLVLAEKWPGVVQRFVEPPGSLDAWLDGPDHDLPAALEGEALSGEVRGLTSAPPRLDGDALTGLADWYAFEFYASRAPGGRDRPSEPAAG